MPFYDLACVDCAWTKVDAFEHIERGTVPCPDCGAPTVRAWLTKPANVIGDEMHHLQKNGLKEPRLFTSKIEHRRWLKANGYRIFDTHVGEQGSDKNKYTSSVNGIDAQTMDNAKQLVSRASEAGRRDESKAPIGITSFDGLMNYLTMKRKSEAGEWF